MAGTTARMEKASLLPPGFLMPDEDGEMYWLALGKTKEELEQVKLEVSGMDPYEGKAFPLYFGRMLVVQKIGNTVAFFNRTEAAQAEHELMLARAARRERTAG